MELIDQHTKKIMEGCKRRAWDAGLTFSEETLEYIVTNRDMLNLSPKNMIPTLYDYWVHDVEVLKERGKYELYPHNPYETVINTRPAISFYNDNNPDWLNVMIFYHVLGHVDFFQNNYFFEHTWDYDFAGQALSDKRMIEAFRAEHGRWVDYVIEFSRGIDNLVGYHRELSRKRQPKKSEDGWVDYYFDVFLQKVQKVRVHEYVAEIERFNQFKRTRGAAAEKAFFDSILLDHPEFEALYEKYRTAKKDDRLDLFQYLIAESPFLNKEKNKWMQSVMEVVRNTSVYFQPQIRTKIMNEGWASYWHEVLFLSDDRIRGHEVEFARINAGVTSLPRVGLNPYALGMRLFYHLEEEADKGRRSFEYDRLKDRQARKDFDKKTGQGHKYIFDVRRDFCDFTFIQTFITQDFVDRHRLFVAGRQFNQQRMAWQIYVQSRKAADYKKMVTDSLYHPPKIRIEPDKGEDGALYLNHAFEGKPLVKEFIPNTLIGIEYLWGGPVQLETSEVVSVGPSDEAKQSAARALTPQTLESIEREVKWQRVLYTVKGRKLSKQNI